MIKDIIPPTAAHETDGRPSVLATHLQLMEHEASTTGTATGLLSGLAAGAATGALAGPAAAIVGAVIGGAIGAAAAVALHAQDKEAREADRAADDDSARADATGPVASASESTKVFGSTSADDEDEDADDILVIDATDERITFVPGGVEAHL